MTDFNLTFVGPRGESVADLARRLGLVTTTATEIEALMAALNRRVAVAASAIGNVSVTAAPAALDGVTLTSGQLILLPAQTVPAENGVYVFAGAGAALVRWTGADAWYELPALVVGVQGGATHANSAWQCFNEHGGILGTTAVTFLKLASSLNALLALSNTWSGSNTWIGAGRFNPAAEATPLVVGPGYNGGVAVNTGDREVYVGAWSGAPGISFNRHNINSWRLIIGSDGSLQVIEGGNERARFLSSGGRLGLGTTDPRAKLDLGTDVTAQKLLLYGGPLNRIGLGLASGEFRIFADTGGEITLGHVSSADGTTFTPGWRMSGSHAWYPAADASFSLGTASFRTSVVYSATGTINTSDATEKSDFEPIPPGVAAAGRALMGRIGVYQWLASVAEKGPDKARLHIGLKAQDVRDAFLDEGEDPSRWGLFCEDPILEPVTRTRMVERPVLEPRTRAQEIIVVEDGVAVQRIVEERAEEPVFDLVPVVDEAGQPVLRQVTAADENGDPVILQEPLLHAVAVTETVEETYEVMEPTGETRLGLRHEQLLMLFLAVLAEGG
jgi:hypothetical protein